MMVVCGDGIVGVESESSLRSGLDRVDRKSVV